MSNDNEHSEHLSDISLGMMERFAVSGDVVSALDWSLTKLLSSIKAQAGSLFLVNKAEDELRCAVCIGPRDITGIKVSIPSGLVGKAYIDRRGSLISDAQASDLHNHSIDEKYGFVTRSILTVPIVYKDRCFGCLQAINLVGETNQIESFNESHLAVFNKLASVLGVALQNVEYASELVKDALIKKDLQSAEETQRLLFPDLNFDDSVVGEVIPARNLSGDFVDYFSVDDEVYFCQGDVAGKGIPAALTVARCLAFFRFFARQSKPIKEIVGLMNDEILEMSERSQKTAGFVTFFIGCYSKKNNSVKYVNCGHGDVVILNSVNDVEIRSANLPPLGVIDSKALTINEISVDIKGRRIFVFTDGILESRTTSKELGLEGAIAIFKAVNKSNSKNALSKIMDLFRVGKLSTSDDATLMIVG